MSCFVALLAVQAALRRRDTEIGRLGAQVERGRDVDGLVMHHRNETNESIILQLHQQVGIWSWLSGDGLSLTHWPALLGGSQGASHVGLRCWEGAREPHTLACAGGREPRELACRSTPVLLVASGGAA